MTRIRSVRFIDQCKICAHNYYRNNCTFEKCKECPVYNSENVECSCDEEATTNELRSRHCKNYKSILEDKKK